EHMFNAGAHYGYSKTRRHPSVSPFIYATKNRTDIINLEETSVMLSRAMEFAKELGQKGKVVLFVGSKAEARETVREAAESAGMPYVTERWIGGTISNFPEIKKRIAELENYQKENKEGTLDRYTKKERMMMAKKMERLARYYTGLLSLKKIPDALYIVDAKKESIALTEARKSGVPVIALVNSDTNIKKVDYPVLSNDAGIPSIKFFTKQIIDAYKSGAMSAQTKE
ncbi:MAG TPA: 30S ribosomal protein S2, partial [Candidatus Paceibacterota bacterium]|nr:30S ribosomal protein S2 [Candidatus Paceibacterota bacterium]